MFYENERILRKQQKYVRSKAYNAYEMAKAKGLTDEEIVAVSSLAIDIGSDILTETQVDIIKATNNIALNNMEVEDESDNTKPITTS